MSERSLRKSAPLMAFAILAVVPTLSCAQAPIDPTAVHQSEHHAYRVVPVVDGLQHPWGIAFLPSGEMLVTERPGRLRVVRNGQLSDPVAGLPEIRVGGQGGLLDVVLHPAFSSNRLLYLSFSKPNDDGSQGTTAVIRGRFENDALHDVEEVFVAEAWTQGGGHHGSRIAFDRDGYMFVTIGDRQARPAGDLRAHPAQDLSNHYGTTVRLYDDGRVPQDNPFVGVEGALPSIWSYGHRNQQGMAVHPESNQVWQNEHGPQGGDELNLVEAGKNYGWPVVGFGVNYGSGTPIHEAVREDGMEQPVHLWVPSIATSGLMIYTGDRFPMWRGNVFSGGLAGEVLSRVTLDGSRAVAEEFLVRNQGRIRDVRQGPDGLIYLAIDHRGGELTPVVRLEPVGGN